MKHYINLQSVVALCRPWDNDGEPWARLVQAKLDELNDYFRVPVGKREAVRRIWRKLCEMDAPQQERVYIDAFSYVQTHLPKYLRAESQNFGDASIIELSDLSGGAPIRRLGIATAFGAPCLYLKHNGRVAAYCAPRTIEDADRLIDALTGWKDSQNLRCTGLAPKLWQWAALQSADAITGPRLLERIVSETSASFDAETFLGDLPRAVAHGYLCETPEHEFYRGPIEPGADNQNQKEIIDIDL